MPRLRTTTAWSLLALGVGIAGTGWLSGQTAGWVGPVSRAAVAAGPRTVASAPATRRPRHASPAMAPRAPAPAVVRATPQSPVATAAPPALVPLSTPPDPTPYVALRGHLDGRVTLRVTLDGAGRVRRAAVGGSSGDPRLDAHALATVSRWRFAVPADRPEGFSGDLSMRFDSAADRLAHTR